MTHINMQLSRRKTEPYGDTLFNLTMRSPRKGKRECLVAINIDFDRGYGKGIMVNWEGIALDKSDLAQVKKWIRVHACGIYAAILQLVM